MVGIRRTRGWFRVLGEANRESALGKRSLAKMVCGAKAFYRSSPPAEAFKSVRVVPLSIRYSRSLKTTGGFSVNVNGTDIPWLFPGHQAEPIRVTNGQNIYYRAALEFCLVLVNRRRYTKRIRGGLRFGFRTGSRQRSCFAVCFFELRCRPLRSGNEPVVGRHPGVGWTWRAHWRATRRTDPKPLLT